MRKPAHGPARGRAFADPLVPSGTAESYMEVLGNMATLRILGPVHHTPEVRPLPSAGITRLRRYDEPVRLPRRPGLSLTGVRLGRYAPPGVSRVACDLRVQACGRPYPGGTVGGISSLPGCLRRRPSPCQRRVGSHLKRFEACSAFLTRYGLPARGAAYPSVPSKAPAMSLPSPPLRLLPAGAKVAGWDLHPLKIDAFAWHTLTPLSSMS
jgi:hypothetical protein